MQRSCGVAPLTCHILPPNGLQNLPQLSPLLVVARASTRSNASQQVRGSPAPAAAGYAEASLGQVSWGGASVGAAASVRARVADCSSIPVPACLAPTTTASQYLYYSTARGAGQPSCSWGRGRQGRLSGDGALENTTGSAPAGPACTAPTNIPSQYTNKGFTAGAGQSSSGCGRLRRSALGPSQQGVLSSCHYVHWICTFHTLVSRRPRARPTAAARCVCTGCSQD